MPCLICGSPDTVESHIVPRALYRALAGDGQHAKEGSRFKAGVKFQTKGVFDKTILCAGHEASLGESDDYGVAFVKGFYAGGTVTASGYLWTLPNPKPELLVKFMASLIWRRGVSNVGRGPADISLGSYEPRLRALIFAGDQSYRPPMMVARKPIVSQGTLLHELMFEPCRGNGWGADVWSFHALGCQITMNLNPFGANPFPSLVIANSASPLNAWNFEPEEISDIEGALDIAVNMFLDRKTGKPRKL